MPLASGCGGKNADTNAAAGPGGGDAAGGVMAGDAAGSDAASDGASAADGLTEEDGGTTADGNGSGEAGEASDPSLALAVRTIAVAVGDNETIPVIATKADGSDDAFTVISSDPSVATASISGHNVVVTGIASSPNSVTITVTAGSGAHLDISVAVSELRALDVNDELLLAYVDQFDPRWNDQGSGADADGAYYAPITTDGFYALGSYGRTGYDNPNQAAAVVVAKSINGSDALAPPSDYTLVWEDHGSGANLDGAFWQPVPPNADYVCLGLVSVVGYGNKPSPDAVRCVKKTYTAHGVAGPAVWLDVGSGADVDFGSWSIVPDPNVTAGTNVVLLPAGTFVGAPTHAVPTDSAVANVLRFPLPVITDVELSSIAPVQSNFDEPPDVYPAQLSKVVAMPFSLVDDAGRDLHWKVTNSPFYRIERDVYFKKLDFLYNQTSSDQSVSDTATVGTDVSKTESFGVSTGITIETQAGFGVASVSTSFSITFSYDVSTTTSVSMERSVQKTLNAAPDTAATLWQLVNQYQLLRHSELGTWDPVSAWTSGLESFVATSYP